MGVTREYVSAYDQPMEYQYRIAPTPTPSLTVLYAPGKRGTSSYLTAGAGPVDAIAAIGYFFPISGIACRYCPAKISANTPSIG